MPCGVSTRSHKNFRGPLIPPASCRPPQPSQVSAYEIAPRLGQWKGDDDDKEGGGGREEEEEKKEDEEEEEDGVLANPLSWWKERAGNFLLEAEVACHFGNLSAVGATVFGCRASCDEDAQRAERETD